VKESGEKQLLVDLALPAERRDNVQPMAAIGDVHRVE
jgi:hypothetical protein